jgi:hypothetical protein
VFSLTSRGCTPESEPLPYNVVLASGKPGGVRADAVIVLLTLLQLQRTVEALSGARLHRQNFRRLVERQGLVEETGGISAETSGRPARLVRFRREVLLERPAPGLRLRAGLRGA